MVEENLQEQRPSRDEGFTINVIDDLARLPDDKMQALLEKVGGHRDLSLVMQRANREVQDKVLNNMPVDKRDRLEYHALLAKTDNERATRAQERILQMAAEAGQQPAPTPAKPRELSAGVQAAQEQLQHLPFARMDLEKRVRFFAELAALVKTEGIVVLEHVVDGIDQPGADAFVQDAQLLAMELRFAVDGTWPSLVVDIMATRMDSLIHHLETRHRMIIDGVLGLQQGNGQTPQGLWQQLHYHHSGFDSSFWGESDRPHRGYLADLKEKLQVSHFLDLGSADGFVDSLLGYLLDKLGQQPLSQMSFRGLCDLFAEMVELTRQKGIGTIEKLLEAIDDLLRRGLRLAIEGADPALIRELLQGRSRNLVRQQEINYRMICVGVEALQGGEEPEIVSERVRCLFEV